MKQISSILLSCLLLLPTGMNAEKDTPKQWTLRDCIDYALEHNITIQLNRISAESAQEDVKTAKADFLPSLSGNISQRVVNRPNSARGTIISGDNITTSESKTSYNGSYGIDANWTVYNGSKRVNTVKQQKLNNRIAKLKEDLKKIDRQMAVQRSNRGAMVRVALVGYTNVGKSTLMNLISKSEVFAENKLFATLDTTVRKVVFDNLPFLLSDTVGFIRKLPTELIESFKSTLDEVREADLLVHVVDISHPQFEEQIAVVKQTLQEIGAGDKPVYLVFNKVDAYTYIEKEEDDLTPATRENLSLEELKKSWIARANTPCIFLSALAKTNLEKFRSDLYGMVREIHAGRYPFNNFLY